MSKVLTTGQAAKLAQCAPRTITKWIDSGELKGYRLPGSKDRRVREDQLRIFCRKHDIPILGDLRIWIVDDPGLVYTKIVRAILDLSGQPFEIEMIESESLMFRLGMEAPDLLVVNYDIEGTERIVKILDKSDRLLILTSSKLPLVVKGRLGNARVLEYTC